MYSHFQVEIDALGREDFDHSCRFIVWEKNKQDALNRAKEIYPIKVGDVVNGSTITSVDIYTYAI